VVKEAIVGEGPTLKRMMARARGSGSQILKRTSHIRIVLSDEIPIVTRETRKAKREQEKKAKKQATSEAGESSTAGTGKKLAKPKKTAKPKK
jgi:large subunit ribosomal protein L22